MSHLEPCYTLPRLDDSLCGEQSSICGEPTFTAILLTRRGNCLNLRRGRKRETALEGPQRSTSLVTHTTDRETEGQIHRNQGPGFSLGFSVSSFNQQSYSLWKR